MTLTDNDIDAALDYYIDWIGFSISVEQFRDLIKDDIAFQDDLTNGPDTLNREWFMSIFAQRVVGRNWPTFGDGHEAYVGFAQELREKAPQMGYRMLGE